MLQHPRVGQWELRQAGFCVPQYSLSTSLQSGTIKCSVLFHLVLFLARPWNKPLLPEALVKEPGFLGVFGNQDLDTKCAHGHYSVIVPKPFEWTELENICKTTSHTHAYHMYIYIYFHIYLSILKTMRSHCFLYTTVQHYRVYSSNGCQIKLRMLSSIWISDK